MSEIQANASMWAAIEGVMRNDPHPRSKLQKTLRAKLIATDAKGQQTEVRLIVRQASEAYREMLTIRHGERVRVIGPMSTTPSPIAGEPPQIAIDVDSAVRLEGAERTKHSVIERLTKRLNFWSTK